MRSLSTKLTLAFVLVGLTGALLVALLVRYRTQSAFDQFVHNQEIQVLATNLAQYYQLNGGWEGVDEVIPALLNWMGTDFDGNEDSSENWKRLDLMDPDQVVIFSLDQSKIGEELSDRELEGATQLIVNGYRIGWILASPSSRAWTASTPEGRFLNTVNGATVISGLVAVALALALGSLLAFTMTRSLRELTDATVDIARGALGRQVKVRTKDELGELAQSFNQMSTDLKRSTNARRQMTADIAHDLRSPLSVIAGYAEALNDGKLPGSAEVYTILHQETQQLNRLIDDLRTLSLADAGELTLYLQPANPVALLQRVAAHHKINADEKGIILETSTPQDLPEVQIDVERMVQVLNNLVSNSIRHTPEGGKVLMSANSTNGHLEFRVKDSGSGISAEDLPYIFDRFYKGDKARSTAEESGLGLAIARSIVEAHGGHIRVESQQGQGTEFTVLI